VANAWQFCGNTTESMGVVAILWQNLAEELGKSGNEIPRNTMT
jgi:hypothetical protein